MTLDLDALRKWNQRAAASNRNRKPSWFIANSIARLDGQLTSKHPHSMSTLWIAGNETNGFEAVWVSLRIGLIAAIVFYVLFREMLIGPDPQRRAIFLASSALIWGDFLLPAVR